MVVAEASYKRDTWISIYAIPGLKFHNKPQLDQEARADVKILSDQIYDWYKQKFPKVTGDQKAFAES